MTSSSVIIGLQVPQSKIVTLAPVGARDWQLLGLPSDQVEVVARRVGEGCVAGSRELGLQLGELWRRTRSPSNGSCCAAPLDLGHDPDSVELTYGDAAEFQRRAVVDLHLILRLDGHNPADPSATWSRRHSPRRIRVERRFRPA
jgi:hypothetical protein